MPHRRFEWHERIKAVEREYWSARRAIDRLSADVARDPGALGEGPSPRDLRSADENLEGTYLVRMFAEFETGVRSFWGCGNWDAISLPRSLSSRLLSILVASQFPSPCRGETFYAWSNATRFP